MLRNVSKCFLTSTRPAKTAGRLRQSDFTFGPFMTRAVLPVFCGTISICEIFRYIRQNGRAAAYAKILPFLYFAVSANVARLWTQKLARGLGKAKVQSLKLDEKSLTKIFHF